MKQICQIPSETNDEGANNPQIKQLRKCAGYENISDEEATVIIESIKEFSLLMYMAESTEKK